MEKERNLEGNLIWFPPPRAGNHLLNSEQQFSLASIGGKNQFPQKVYLKHWNQWKIPSQDIEECMSFIFQHIYESLD